ncbi:hypothetical protein ACTFIZ_002675 [Dictyostelium cf. discoideum]
MDITEYNYIIKILKDNKIIGDNYIEKKKINNIRKLYSISKKQDKTILSKIIKEKKRIVISHNEMNQVFYKCHDKMDHNNKSQFNELLKDYYWETKQMDLDYYLSICKVCHDKYKVADGKEKTKKRLQQLKSETSRNSSSSTVPKQIEKKRKLEEYSDDSDSGCDPKSHSDSDESDSDGETKVVIKNKSNSKLPLSVSTKKKTPSSSSPSKPIQNILPKQPPKKKLELSNSNNFNGDDDDDDDDHDDDDDDDDDDEEQSISVNKKKR